MVELGPRPVRTEFPPLIKKGERFDEPQGIIAGLRRRVGFSGGDVVRATGSRPLSGNDEYSPTNALHFETGDAFISVVDPEGDPPRGSWLCYDFLGRRIVPRQYAIRTHDDPPGKEHLRSWIVEGSLDGNNWELLDSQRKNEALNGFRFIAMFPLAGTTERRFVRITSMGKSHHRDWMIQIEAWELFGTLIE
jgi:hypothetical protein